MKWLKKKRLCLLLTMDLASMSVGAQSFGDDTYRSVGIYDTWEQSPFRTGVLQGNVAVITNHLYSATGVNRTGHIVGIQRSRFGSNTFGVRIDMNTAVTIGRSGKYVHALVYSPRATKVQFIGLGRRTSNTWGQTGDAEQFWSEPVSIGANTWTDVVAKVQTGDNVQIESIVVVPDCQSPHSLTTDFVAYVDEVVVNTSSRSRTSVASADDPYDNTTPEIPDDPTPDPDDDGIYALNFEKTRTNTRAYDHYIRGISLTSSSESKQQWASVNSNTALTTNLYLDGTPTRVMDVVAGESYTPYIDYSTDWMHAYCYIDYDRNGTFVPMLSDDAQHLAEGSELVSYSAYSTDYSGGATGTWYNSSGTYLGNMTQGNYQCNTMTMPAFTIPIDLQSGLYRMRMKVDWCSIDPGGNDGSDGTNNQIWADGGGIVDVLLRVSGRNDVSVATSSARNGSLTNAESVAIGSTPLMAPYAEPYIVRMIPANDFITESLTAFYKANSSDYAGYLVNDTITFTTSSNEYDADADAFVLPASVMYSEVRLEPMFNMAPIIVINGDTNGDGVVTIADVTGLVNIILGVVSNTPPEGREATPDVNGDGAVTIADVTALVNIILGK